MFREPFSMTNSTGETRRKICIWKYSLRVDINNVHWTADIITGGHIKSVFQALQSKW